MATENKNGLPNKQQLIFMLQRYSNIELIPIDNNQESIKLSSETAQFKKPIFIDCDTGKMSKKIHMAMEHQAAFATENPDKDAPSRIFVDGNLSLVRKAIHAHSKLLGDDPYNPTDPFANPISLMEGVNIPEYDAFDLPDDESTH